jgi:hypothetical protein
MNHAALPSLSEKPGAISDDYMKDRLSKTKPYTVVILKKGPAYQSADASAIIWEHGRKNFALREGGWLAIVCPVNDGTEISGIGIFTADAARTRSIMDEDPAIKAGVLVYEVHPAVSFPGSTLP